MLDLNAALAIISLGAQRCGLTKSKCIGPLEVLASKYAGVIAVDLGADFESVEGSDGSMVMSALMDPFGVFRKTHFPEDSVLSSPTVDRKGAGTGRAGSTTQRPCIDPFSLMRDIWLIACSLAGPDSDEDEDTTGASSGVLSGEGEVMVGCGCDIEGGDES